MHLIIKAAREIDTFDDLIQDGYLDRWEANIVAGDLVHFDFSGFLKHVFTDIGSICGLQVVAYVLIDICLLLVVGF